MPLLKQVEKNSSSRLPGFLIIYLWNVHISLVHIHDSPRIFASGPLSTWMGDCLGTAGVVGVGSFFQVLHLFFFQSVFYFFIFFRLKFYLYALAYLLFGIKKSAALLSGFNLL